MESAQRKASDVKVLSKAERILSQYRPFLQREGSDVRTKDFRDGVLSLEVSGACVGCALANNDLGDIGEMLKTEIPEVKSILFLNRYGLPIF